MVKEFDFPETTHGFACFDKFHVELDSTMIVQPLNIMREPKFGIRIEEMASAAHVPDFVSEDALLPGLFSRIFIGPFVGHKEEIWVIRAFQDIECALRGLS